jgi:hypothetical protein
MASDLEHLVDTEARLDRELAIARARAAALEDEARVRVERADAELTSQLEAARREIAAETEREAAARIVEAERAAAAEIARFDAVRDEHAIAIARHAADLLVALVAGEEAP